MDTNCETALCLVGVVDGQQVVEFARPLLYIGGQKVAESRELTNLTARVKETVNVDRYQDLILQAQSLVVCEAIKMFMRRD